MTLFKRIDILNAMTQAAGDALSCGYREVHTVLSSTHPLRNGTEVAQLRGKVRALHIYMMQFPIVDNPFWWSFKHLQNTLEVAGS